MEWQEWGKQLREVLALERSPVAVTYADLAPPGASTEKCRVCGALRQSTEGAVIDLTAENSACPGGSLPRFSFLRDLTLYRFRGQGHPCLPTSEWPLFGWPSDLNPIWSRPQCFSRGDVSSRARLAPWPHPHPWQSLPPNSRPRHGKPSSMIVHCRALRAPSRPR